MPRDLPVGNGSLLVNFDAQYQLRDLYWPHIGQENHTAGHPFRFGIWVDGGFHWVAESGWRRVLGYEPRTLVTRVTLTHPAVPVTLLCQDVVDFHENLYLRKILVRNDRSHPCVVRLFFAQDFHINGLAVGDSAYYEPERLAVFHYKDRCWFLINCGKLVGDDWQFGVDQWAVGVKESFGREGTWRDAEDGLLSGNATAQGSIDSCVALHLTIPAQSEATGWYWIAVGEDFHEVTRINRAVRQRTPTTFYQRTAGYWALWVANEAGETADLPETLNTLYQRSLLVLRTQVDHGGAILAATDYDMARVYSDTYAYMWPRDGAIAVAALIDAGFSEVSRRFFEFCHHVITPEGYLLHKYNADGSLASSWHGWLFQGHKELPVQEDETALVLWALWRHFQRFRDVEFIKPLFRGLIVRAANWLVEYRDQDTGLPLPSWDLWEERHGVFPWTIGAVWGGLQAAANFAEAFGEATLANTYRHTADEIRQATEKQLWSPEMACFTDVCIRNAIDPLLLEQRPESSVVGLWLFGMIPPDDPRIVSSMRYLRERLWVKTPIGGIARYADDRYQRVTQDDANVPGNPWFICTLWFAQWYLAIAKTPTDAAPALELLDWVAQHALPSGILAEQVHPYTGEPLSVSPLTWSHATLVLTIRQYLAWLNGGTHYTDWHPKSTGRW